MEWILVGNIGSGGGSTPVFGTADTGAFPWPDGVTVLLAGSDSTITLPDSPSIGTTLMVIKTDAPAYLEIDATGTAQIQGMGSIPGSIYLSTPGETCTIVWDGTGWWIIDRSQMWLGNVPQDFLDANPSKIVIPYFDGNGLQWANLSLNDLVNVDAPTPADHDVVAWSNDEGKWTAQTLSGGGGSSTPAPVEYWQPATNGEVKAAVDLIPNVGTIMVDVATIDTDGASCYLHLPGDAVSGRAITVRVANQHFTSVIILADDDTGTDSMSGGSYTIFGGVDIGGSHFVLDTNGLDGLSQTFVFFGEGLNLWLPIGWIPNPLPPVIPKNNAFILASPDPIALTTSAVWAPVTDIYTIQVAARQGDTIEIALNAFLPAAEGAIYFDAITYVAAAPVSSCGNTWNPVNDALNGVGSWVCSDGEVCTPCGSIFYTVQDYDIEDGNVTLQLSYKATADRSIPTTDCPISFSVKNLGAGF